MSWEFLTIYWRDMLRFVRFRIALVVSLIQPALWMALYGAAMSSNFSRLGAGMTVPDGAVAGSGDCQRARTWPLVRRNPRR